MNGSHWEEWCAVQAESLLRWIQVFRSTQAHSTRDSWRELVMPCEGFKLTNLRTFWQTLITRWKRCRGIEGFDEMT